MEDGGGDLLECAGPVCAPNPPNGLAGASGFRCYVLVRGLFGTRLGLSAPFIKWLGVATNVAMLLASDLLMYYFVRSL